MPIDFKQIAERQLARMQAEARRLQNNARPEAGAAFREVLVVSAFMRRARHFYKKQNNQPVGP